VSLVALLDVNLLVALFDPDHIHHDLAHTSFEVHHRNSDTCAATENGSVRVLTNPAYGATVRRPTGLVEPLGQFCSTKHHVFWADAVSLSDKRIFNRSMIRGHRQVTDVYLLGLAKKMGGCLATFDRTIPLGAVNGATRSTLAVVSAT